MFDKMTPETYRLVEEKAGKPVATVLFVVFLLAALCGGVALVVVSVKAVALNAVLPLVNAVTSRFSASQVWSVTVSVAVALLALFALSLLAQRTARNFVRFVIGIIDDRINHLTRVVREMQGRLEHLEAHAASTQSVNGALRAIHAHMPVPTAPEGVDVENLNQAAVLHLLNPPAAESVGQRPPD